MSWKGKIRMRRARRWPGKLERYYNHGVVDRKEEKLQEILGRKKQLDCGSDRMLLVKGKH